MARIAPPPDRFDVAVEVVVVGAGACGLTAGLRAAEAGAETLVLERDPRPTGSTAMSSGFVPAGGTRFQRAAGIEDSPAALARDIRKKAGGDADAAALVAATGAIAPALEWLADAHGLEWQVLTEFLYPGHSAHRMHAVPERTGAALMTRLLAAAERAELSVATGARVETLFADEAARIHGVGLVRPDGAVETVGCGALVLAANGYGGNPELVARHIPEMATALYYGHAGNTGDALLWGQVLGAEARHLSGCQGHGSLAHPHGILITWALMMEGAIQVNADGRRFSNEQAGYSEQAVKVLAQPGGVAWNVYDERLHRLGQDFPDYRTAVEAGAVLSAPDAAALAVLTGLPAEALAETLAEVAGYAAGQGADPFGRDFMARPALGAPLYAVRVTGALFHTQGGLAVDGCGWVLRPDGTALPNLYAGGGAAVGVSGPRIDGYLSGNGLLTAIGLGYLAGRDAALCARGRD